MSKIRSSVFLKTVAFILHQICFVMIAVTLFIGVTYWNYDDTSVDIIEQDDFTKTSYYKRLVENHIYDLITYIGYCGKFQTNGMIDENRIIDIYDYVQNDRVTGLTTISFGYSISDLLAWEEEGFYYISSEDNGIYDELDELGEKADYRLAETFSNTVGMSIPDYAAAKQQDYREIYRVLEKASQKLAEEFTAYKSQVSLFKANNTNLRYAVYDEDKEAFYTNMGISGIREGLEQIGAMETYVILNSATADFNSNIFYANDQLNQYLNALYAGNQNCVLAVGVDTQFPVLDDFHREQLRYNNLDSWFMVLYKLLLMSIAGYVVSFFYLSASAGHKKGSLKPALTFLEKVKTEIFAAAFLGGEIYLLYVISNRMNGFSLPAMSPVTLMTLGSLSLAIGLLFSVCYLSFLRRLKARTLWENSILHMLTDFWRAVRGSRRLWLKVTLGSVAIVAAVIAAGRITGSYIEMTIVGICLLAYGYYVVRDSMEQQKIAEGCQEIANGNLDFKIETGTFFRKNRILGDVVNQICFVLHEAVEDRIKSERLKTNLITNVSHDIKTPLTSIINYVALLKKIPLENPKALEYIQILDEKSQRLKHLAEDLVEASKISSGNISLEKTRLNFVELVKQTSGEFCEHFEEQELTLVTAMPDAPVMIDADGRRIWRILENIYNNALKYSLKNSRVFAALEIQGDKAVFTLKNVSAQPLNIDAQELTKRFVRGDVARTTQGSGLGLSIARDLTQLHGGVLNITTDGDLFCVTIVLPLAG